ncbi:MAG: alpha/beta hydrolase family protein [Burkholderiaceae bacterium]
MNKICKFTIACTIAISGASLLTGLCIAQPLNLDTALNENVVMIPADANVPTLPTVTVPHTISSGSSPSDATNGSVAPKTSNSRNVMLETTIFKPAGAGPFPILILNHGKSIGNPHLQERARFLVISKEFVKRGYAVVIPMRTGFGKSTGDYVEEECNMTENGNIQAHDLQSVLNYTLQQNWADKNRIIIAGQSYGGLTTMAFGARNFPGVKGLINFAGGLKTSGSDCQWQSSLVDAYATYGRTSRTPSIWFYGENDSYFNPEQASKMHVAYVNAGGNAKLVVFSAFKKDAHGMSSSRDGVRIWWPEVETFLQQIGMPTKEIYSLPPEMRMARTDFASVDNIDAVPYLSKSGRDEYRSFLSKSLPRAFAISSTGAWSWAEDGDEPEQSAIANCNKISRAPCKLYAVDNDVVWINKG